MNVILMGKIIRFLSLILIGMLIPYELNQWELWVFLLVIVIYGNLPKFSED